MDLGRRLREAREQAGLSLREISARTKISGSTLAALEAGHFERLPGDFYVRSFLKAYAREVHLSADELVREYDELRHPPLPEPVAAPVRQPDAPRPLLRPFTLRVPNKSNFWAGVVFFGLLFTVAVIVARETRPRGDRPEQAVGTAGVVDASAAATAPAATEGHTASAVPAIPPGVLRVDIRPTAPVWVAAKADGVNAVYRVLQPGDQVVVEGRKALWFRIGNAGAFTYTVNGEPGKPLGSAGDVRDFNITPDNYLTFRR